MGSIIYASNGATGLPPSDTNGYRPNETATVLDNINGMTKAGYVFAGWNTAADGTGTSYLPGDLITVTQSSTLYAMWVEPPQQYTVTYEGNGSTAGSVPVDESQYLSGEAATVLDNLNGLEKEGYNFAGWNTAADGTGTVYAAGDVITVTKDVTLYAVWTEQPAQPVQYTVTYDGNGSTAGSVPVDESQYLSGEAATVLDNLNGLENAEYIFAGWNTAADGTGTAYAAEDAIIVTENVTLYAVWTEQPPQYTVTYDGNGSTAGNVPVDESQYLSGDKATILGNTGGLVKSGYLFGGWYVSNDETEKAYASGDSLTITHNITLKAKWLPITIKEIILDRTAYTLNIKDQHQTVMTAVYSDNSRAGITTGVTYSSSNSNVATVNSNGLVTALAQGNTVITAVYGGKQAQAQITVNAPVTEPSRETATPPPGVEIIVDGVNYSELATAKQETVNGRTITTIILDSQKIIEKLNRENSKLITIPVSGSSDMAIGQLDASLVKAMQSKGAGIQIITDKASYTLPAAQIDIDSIAKQFGADVKLEDIKIEIEISESQQDKASQVQAAAKENQYTIVAAPVDFQITVSYGNQSVSVNKFNSYVERRIAIPSGTDASKITTAVVLTADNQLVHVPTVVVEENGKHYAIINSLSNSTYAVIYSPQEMNDVNNHWAKADVNDMSSRLIINGVKANEFQPETSITRAEFVAIVLRGLGIQEDTYADSFNDVAASNWYAGAVQSAINYKLIEGYEDQTFRPNQTISRQEAISVLSRALAIANLEVNLSAAEASSLLSAFTDGDKVASWAQANVAAAIKLHIMKGKGEQLDADADLTRAEGAALVRRFLQAANLIN